MPPKQAKASAKRKRTCKANANNAVSPTILERTPREFVHPYLRELHAKRNTDEIEFDNDARHTFTRWSIDSVPVEARPFIEDLELRTLEASIRAHPWLYVHPTIFLQTNWLHVLAVDRKGWLERGWRPGEGGACPAEAREAWEARKALIRAHVEGSFRSMRMELKPLPRRPGRRGGIRNPYPTDPDNEWLTLAQLEHEYAAMAAAFKQRRRELPDIGPRRILALEAFVNAAIEVLEKVNPLWSGLSHPAFVAEPPTDLTTEQQGFFVLANTEWEWDREHLWDAFKEYIEASTFADEVARHGKAPYAAYMTLAALLDTTPKAIIGKLFRRRSKRTVG